MSKMACLILGIKRTSPVRSLMSANDPKRTLRHYSEEQKCCEDHQMHNALKHRRPTSAQGNYANQQRKRE